MKELKKVYSVPCVYSECRLKMEGPVMAASIITEDTIVETSGQEIVDHDFTGDEFTFEWS